jgi:hypothetical protein
VNYGFDQRSIGFRVDRMDELAGRLRYLLAEFAPTAGRPAYVEVDEAHPEHEVYLYPGVRMRRLTHYSDADLEQIYVRADAIYDDVMGLEGEGAGSQDDPHDAAESVPPLGVCIARGTEQTQGSPDGLSGVPLRLPASRRRGR